MDASEERQRPITGAAPPPTGAPIDLAGTDVPGDPRAVTTVRFRDPAVAEALADEGYARLGPFLDDGAVAAALAVFEEARAMLGTPLGEAWFPTILLPDDDVRAHITEGLTEIVVPRLEQLVDPASLEVVRLDYSVKPASPTSELGPHQDYALVDERTAQSLYLWIPLCDTDERNGTLHLVPGSHRYTNRIRSRHVPSYFDDVLEEVHAAGTRLDCRAGELIVMVSGVIHWSPPNLSDQLRLAVHVIAKPPEVPLVFYYQDEDTPEGLVECFDLDIERYVQAIHHGRPSGAPTRLEHRPTPGLSLERLVQGRQDRGS